MLTRSPPEPKTQLPPGPGAAIRARQPAVGPRATGGDAFGAIAAEALFQVAANARILRRGPHPEAVHQMRVGLRRLRATLSAFSPILDEAGLRAARAELRWLAGELGAARDLDVVLQRMAGEPPEDDPARAAVLAALGRARSEAYARALAAIRSERVSRLVLRLADWIEAGAWRRLDEPAARTCARGPSPSWRPSASGNWTGASAARSGSAGGRPTPGTPGARRPRSSATRRPPSPARSRSGLAGGRATWRR